MILYSSHMGVTWSYTAVTWGSHDLIQQSHDAHGIMWSCTAVTWCTWDHVILHIGLNACGDQAIISCSGPTSHLKMTRPPGFLFFFFFLETKVERKWCSNSEMHCAGWGLGTRPQNADNCVSKEPKYRSLDGEATECRLCKHYRYRYFGSLDTQNCLHFVVFSPDLTLHNAFRCLNTIFFLICWHNYRSAKV